MSALAPARETDSMKEASANWDVLESGGNACAICGADSPSSVDAVTPSQIEAAWKLMGVSLSREALGDLVGVERIHLWQCRNCGFEYSDLKYAGRGAFYEELQRQLSNYYPANSTEFSRAVNFAREFQLSEVLDVGCGEGAFLDLARKAGLQTHGVELNAKAAAVARSKGHEVYDELLETILARKNYARFDFVTLWQVLEHVPDPVGFLKQCALFLKPSGYLALAVPSESAINMLCPYNPHCWPPHHVTRWRVKDLRRAGEQAGLKFLSGGHDPANMYHARSMWELHNKLAPAFGYRPRPGGKVFPKIVAAGATRLWATKLLPEWGPSTFAFYRAS
jgi:SAM-dependent methyltransferase